MPAVVLTAVPGPATVTVSVNFGFGGGGGGGPDGFWKVAFTLRFLVIVTLQPPVPEQSPPQPVKTHPLLADCDRVTVDSTANVAEQVPGQLIPRGLLDTCPWPETLTFSVKEPSCKGPADAGAPSTNRSTAAKQPTTAIARFTVGWILGAAAQPLSPGCP